MAKDIIRYDLLVQDAMRGVMRKVLEDVVENGYLPGDHHFTISFLTHAPGVQISRRLAEQWPHELTIILQHQYSNLEVDAEGFGVTLSFRSVPENLYIPFSAVTGFFDPSVEFGLRFEAEDEAEAEAGAETSSTPSGSVASLAESSPAAPAKTKKAASPAVETPAADGDGDAKVVSIDAFRKKT
jgi:hypothetical protein